MYKLFMVMCILVNGEVQCTNFDDSDNVTYQTLNECERDAEFRFYGMTDIFSMYNEPYESIEIGCKKTED
tara:strand:- start:4751 stop:4960 length:210 start_codon:yes stop_codon:yes gene_type:complete